MNRFSTICMLIVCLVWPTFFGYSSASAQPKKKAPTLEIVEETKFNIKRHILVTAFSPDGKTLALGSEDVYLYDVSGDTPKEIGVLKSRVGFGIRSMVFSPDGKLLAFGGGDHSVRIWDLEEKKEVFQGKEHRACVRSVAVSPDGKLVATGSDDKTVILWDVGSGGKLSERSVIKAEDKLGDAVKSVVFMQKAKQLLLVTGSSNGTFRVYVVGATVKQGGGFKTKNGFGDVTMRSSANGQLWVITDHKAIHMLNSSGTGLGTLEGHKENVADAAFSPDAKYLASVGRDGTLLVWGVAARVPRITKERPGKFTSVAWAPAAEGSTDLRLAAALEDGTVWVMKLGSK